MQRLYLPSAGQIFIDGTDIAHTDPQWLRRQVGVVLQETLLFSGTLRENIALAVPDASQQQVMAAAALAGAHEFISELPMGYDTPVGEHGGQLSGGQKQRIGLARALITDPKVLILDEATSALDYESERIIHHNMAEICRGRTVFIIAHRLSAVRLADRIIVMERGGIGEQGTHAALLRRTVCTHVYMRYSRGWPDEALSGISPRGAGGSGYAAFACGQGHHLVRDVDDVRGVLMGGLG
jgi:subfamily B ATP-binding cassette protein HlyB/CyaB